MEYIKRDEYIFITYNEVIKSKHMAICKALLKFKDTYNDYLDYTLIEGRSDNELMLLIMSMNTENIFQFLAKKEFNYEDSLNQFETNIMNLYESTELITIGAVVQYMASQKFCKKIYLYTEEYDPRVEIDIEVMFKKSSNIEYVHGDFIEVVKRMTPSPTMYIINHFMYINHLAFIDKLEFTEVLLMTYKYNLTERFIEETGKYELVPMIEPGHIFKEDKPFKMGMLPPMVVKEDFIKVIYEDRLKNIEFIKPTVGK